MQSDSFLCIIHIPSLRGQGEALFQIQHPYIKGETNLKTLSKPLIHNERLIQRV